MPQRRSATADAAAADAAAFRQLTDAYAIVCAEILADDRRRGGGRGRRDGGGGAQPSTAEIMREITDDILEMVEMDVEGEEAGPRGRLPPASENSYFAAASNARGRCGAPLIRRAATSMPAHEACVPTERLQPARRTSSKKRRSNS